MSIRGLQYMLIVLAVLLLGSAILDLKNVTGLLIGAMFTTLAVMLMKKG